MDKRQNKAQIQITDLIDESVNNAVARRQHALESEGFEIDLSDNKNQDCSQIKGGFQSKKGSILVGILVYPSPSSEIQ
jgi:hypothetical protein